MIVITVKVLIKNDYEIMTFIIANGPLEKVNLFGFFFFGRQTIILIDTLAGRNNNKNKTKKKMKRKGVGFSLVL